MKHLLVSLVLLLSCSVSEAAYVGQWRGEVSLKKGGSTEWRTLGADEAKVALASGDELRTARASTAEIFMDDGTRVKVAPVSAFKMSVEDKDGVSLGLYFGRVRSWVKKFSKKFEVRTPSAVCAVRGTDFMVEANSDGDTRVEVYEGSVLAGDAQGNTGLLRQGQFVEIPRGGNFSEPGSNPNEPSNMDATLGSARLEARREIYNEISKADVIARAQEEIQSAEFQNRKVAIDAFGRRVRMEEYTIRPAANQFKYVVLNTRDDNFNFGKILFTFNNALPPDLSLATRNMMSAAGSARPGWELTAINSIMSNTVDKVTEDAFGGKMLPDNPSAPTSWTHFFSDYAVYAQGGDEPVENGGLGKKLWSFSDTTGAGNSDNIIQAGEYYYLGGSQTTPDPLQPDGSDVFHTVTRTTFGDGNYLQAEDFVLFDSGKVLAKGDFSGTLNTDLDSVTDKLNFERVYTSSLFNGRKIDLEYSAKLLKDAGLLRF